VTGPNEPSFPGKNMRECSIAPAKRSTRLLERHANPERCAGRFTAKSQKASAPSGPEAFCFRIKYGLDSEYAFSLGFDFQRGFVASVRIKAYIPIP
jgi:hypothetical protein